MTRWLLWLISGTAYAQMGGGFVPSNGPVTPGAVATFSDLTGCQYNASTPSLTDTQQAAVQCDSTGHVIPGLAFDRVVTGNITAACASGSGCAAGTTVQINVNGTSVIGYETHGTWVATMTTDVSYDATCSSSPGTANWYQTGSIDTDQNETVYLVSWTNANNGDPWVMPIAGAQCARLRASAYTSGTVNVTLDASIGAAAAWVIPTGNTPSGNADFGSPIKVGAKYNATAPTFSDGNRTDLQSDINGNLMTVVNGGIGFPMVNRTDVSTTVTATGNSSSLDSAGLGSGDFLINVTAISGTTPSIQIGIQVSDDNSNWITVFLQKQITATGILTIPAIRLTTRYYRINWVVAGATPSVTFSVTTTLKAAPRTGAQRSVFRYADLNLAANGNASTAFEADDCVNLGVVLVRSADGGPNANVQIFASVDNAKFFTISSNIAANAGTTNASSLAALPWRFYEIQVIAHANSGNTADIQWSCN